VLAVGGGDAQVEDAQPAFGVHVQVVGLDVAVDDGQPVQGGEALEDAGAELGHLAAAEAVAVVEAGLEGGAVVPAHQVVKVAARRVGDDLGEPRVAHPPGQPLFVGEGGGGLRVVVLGAQGLQHAGLAAGVAHAVEQGDDGFVEQGVHRQPVELLAGLEARRQGQLAQAGDVVAQAFGGQGVDPQHQGGAVVLAATAFGRHGEAGGGGLGVGFGLQDVGDLPVAELAPDAVAHQRKYVAGLQLAVGVVHRQVGVEADGAGQHVLQLRVFPHVVGAELLQPAAPQPVDARVPTWAR
jgi:hypothetical protein